MKTAAIYVRVSTADQHVESQLYDLRELAAQRGLEVVQEYRDRAEAQGKERDVRGWTPSSRMRGGRNSPSCSWPRSTESHALQSIFCN